MHEFPLPAMAARATRSASRRVAASRCHLIELSHDELGVIVDGLADPLEPVVAVAFSSTCKGLRTPLRVALEVLQQRHERAVEFCKRVGWAWNVSDEQLRGVGGCSYLRDAHKLTLQAEPDDWISPLGMEEMETLAMILQTNGLPNLKKLEIDRNHFGDKHLAVLFGALGPGALPSLKDLPVFRNKVGPLGAEACAAALARGAMPKLRFLAFYNNPIGNQGVAALKASLRKRELWFLGIADVGLDDDGVSSLMDDLDKDDFKALGKLSFSHNRITNRSYASITSAINRGALPALFDVINRDQGWHEEFPGQFEPYAISEEASRALDEVIMTRIETESVVKTPFSHPELFPVQD